MSYERKNIIFYDENLKLTRNNTFYNVFVIEFFFVVAYYQFPKNY